MYKLAKCSTAVKKHSAELVLMEHHVEVGLINIILRQKNQQHRMYLRLIGHWDPGKYSHPYSY